MARLSRVNQKNFGKNLEKFCSALYTVAMDGINIKLHRTARRITQVELAVEMGVHPLTISEWDRAGAMPSWASVGRLAACFGVEPLELFPSYFDFEEDDADA